MSNTIRENMHDRILFIRCLLQIPSAKESPEYRPEKIFPIDTVKVYHFSESDKIKGIITYKTYR
jgi:hypothetical protein